MIYASRKGLTTMVAAANTVAELDRFAAQAAASHRLYTEMVRPSDDDILFEPEYRRLALPPYVFHHEDEAGAIAFAEAHGLAILPHPAMLEQHHVMISHEQAQARSAIEKINTPSDPRSLREIYGLDKHDPWDTRTPEQQAKDVEVERRAKEARDAGKMSTDSYAGTAQAGAVTVGGIRASTDADGNIVVHEVTAYKDGGTAKIGPYTEIASGHFNVLEHLGVVEAMLAALRIAPTFLQADALDPDITVLSVAGLRSASLVHAYLEFHGIGFTAASMTSTEAGLVEGPLDANAELAQAISDSDKIGIYHRVDCPGLSLSVALRLLDAKEVSLVQMDACGQASDGAWLVLHPERLAQNVARCIDEAHPAIGTEVYAVDRLGGRLVPKGVKVLTGEEERIIGPRPWNAVPPLWSGMDEAQRTEALKNFQWDEFVFTGRHVSFRFGTLVFISPASFVEEQDEVYAEPFPPLNKVLPPDFEEVSAGIFRTRNRDYLGVNQCLSTMGMGESLELQLILNRKRHLYFD